MGDIKHCIIVVTFNQEKLLPVTLDSIFSQSIMPYRVIICDDCSSDDTWGVVERYYDKYPQVIEKIRHAANKGLFANMNFAMQCACGDMVHLVAGDDRIAPDMLKNISNYIVQENLNCDNRFMIVTNSLEFTPNGSKILNNYPLRNRRFLSTDLRGQVCFWDNGYSIGLVKSMPKFREKIGNHADLLQHVGRNVVCEHFYFLDAVGYEYRKNVGVTANTKLLDQYLSYKNVLSIIKSEFVEYLNKWDIHYIDHQIAYYEYLIYDNWLTYFKFIKTKFYFRKVSLSQHIVGLRQIIPTCLKRKIKKISFV